MPGCTGEARHVKRQAGMPGTMGHDQWHAIVCAKCGITLGESDRRFRNRDDAAKAWNDLAKAKHLEPCADAETWLRSRYGAHRGHFAWRELGEAFNAGRASATLGGR
jgi:hypothetical protein